MGRRAEPERRDALLARVVDYLSAHGIGGLSLRPLAAHLGVSTYSLVYHFGGRDGVLVAVLAEVERRQFALVAEWAARGLGLEALMRRYWAWCSAPENRGVVRIVLEAAALAPTRGGLPDPQRAHLMTAWVDLLQRRLAAAGMSPAAARREATLAHATMLGLMLDLVASGDRARLGRAAAELAARTAARALS